jgi:2-polyprenyl-6-methoxyphenol hydroxylase-like FAD-dependent oxidoreductase
MPAKILITGGSIAGATLAWWLAWWGHDVTLMERAPAFREGGQNVDVRGAGREVIRRMGLEDAVRAQGTGEKGIAFVDARNRVRAQIDQDTFGSDGPTAELEILRGDLARLLYDAGKPGFATIFGDRILAFKDMASGIDVTFERGGTHRFDLVLVAEGIGSSTRKLAFGDAVKRRSLGLFMGYFTIARAGTDSEVARWFNAPGGRSVFLRPDNTGTTRVVLTVRQAPDGHEILPPEQQKAFLRDRFGDAGWELPRILAGLDQAEDFYFEAIGQILMDRWSRGRMALTGDAAWCASPISGMGTSLALTGAYVLAGELSRTPDHAAAFKSYERIMRPHVTKAQKVPGLGPRIAQPSTRTGIALQHAAINLLTSRQALTLRRRFGSAPSKAVELPDYR